MFVWMVVEDLCWVVYFRYTTFFNIYYVNLYVVRNNGLTVARSPAASFAVSWLNFEPGSQSFPVKESYLILLL